MAKHCFQVNNKNVVAYEVEPMDTLKKIALKFSMKLEDLTKLNSITKDYQVQLGEDLLVYQNDFNKVSNQNKFSAITEIKNEVEYSTYSSCSEAIQSVNLSSSYKPSSSEANEEKTCASSCDHSNFLSTLAYYVLCENFVHGKIALHSDCIKFLPVIDGSEANFDPYDKTYADLGLNIKYSDIKTIEANFENSIPSSLIQSVMNDLSPSTSNSTDNKTSYKLPFSAIYNNLINTVSYVFPFNYLLSANQETNDQSRKENYASNVNESLINCQQKIDTQSRSNENLDFEAPVNYLCMKLNLYISDESNFKSILIYIDSRKYQKYYQEILNRVNTAESENGRNILDRNSSDSTKMDEIYDELLSEFSNSNFFVGEKIIELIQCLPSKLSYMRLVLLYSTKNHGISLKTLYSKTKDKGPSIIFIEDEKGYQFGGFLSESIRSKSGTYYCSGESFLFSLRPNFKVYLWSKLNQYFVYSSEDSIIIGGGSGKFGIYLDSDLEFGSSFKCDTYLNETLSSSEEFRCFIVEVWGFYI